MGWADAYIAALKRGESVKFRPHGRSMEPIVRSGQLVTVAPVSSRNPARVGDVVLCRVSGRDFLHLVKDITGGRVLIGNNRGHVNGWTDWTLVFGKMVRVEP